MNLIEQLRTLDPRDPGRWPLAVRGFFVGIVFIACSAIAWYMFVWNDDRPVLQKAEADEMDLRSQFENKQQRAANLDAYKAQLGEMERACTTCPLQAIPEEEREAVVARADREGLAIVAVREEEVSSVGCRGEEGSHWASPSLG